MEQSSFVGKTEKRKWSLEWLGGYIATFLLGGALSFVGIGLWGRTEPAPLIIEPPAPTATAVPTTPPGPIRVYINGGVANPDVYLLAPNGIAADALDAAGGFTADAYRDPVNLAQPLADGMQIYVPLATEAAEWRPQVGGMTMTTDQNRSGSEEASNNVGSEVININSATAAELESLPGVGPSTAAKIVAHRDENGPFATIEAIMEVSGIGTGKFEGMRDFIVVGE